MSWNSRQFSCEVMYYLYSVSVYSGYFRQIVHIT